MPIEVHPLLLFDKFDGSAPDPLVAQRGYFLSSKMYQGEQPFIDWAVNGKSSGTFTFNGAPIPANERTHLVLVQDNAAKGLLLYLNGKTKGIASIPQDLKAEANEWDLYIGANVNSKSEGDIVTGQQVYECFTGSIDEVALYKRALEPVEILNLYSMGEE